MNTTTTTTKQPVNITTETSFAEMDAFWLNILKPLKHKSEKEVFILIIYIFLFLFNFNFNTLKKMVTFFYFKHI